MKSRPLQIQPTGEQKRRWVWASKKRGQRLTAWAAAALDEAAQAEAEGAGGFPFVKTTDPDGIRETKTKPVA